jgi:methionyl-tRNA formyltransferase
MQYSQIFVFGSVQFSYHIAERLQAFALPVILFDTNIKFSPYLRKLCQFHDVNYEHKTRQELSSLLSKLSNSTLIISAVNSYILPAHILEKENIKAINYHPALLPKHPGRNVEAWTIYEMDEVTGITWHFVNSEIDAGKIIAQKTIPLHDRYTSLSLMRDLNMLALNSFDGLIKDLIDDKICGYPQNISSRPKLHYSWEIPNDGILNLEWPGEKISAFLRCMDYGILEVFRKPVLVYGGVTYQWKNYLISRIIKSNHRDMVIIDKSKIEILKDNYQIQLLNHVRKDQ